MNGYSAGSGRLAQLGEHQLDKLGVTGSSPVAPTRKHAGLQNQGLSGGPLSWLPQDSPRVGCSGRSKRGGEDGVSAALRGPENDRGSLAASDISDTARPYRATLAASLTRSRRSAPPAGAVVLVGVDLEDRLYLVTRQGRDGPR
jgi:hypothetical protein